MYQAINGWTKERMKAQIRVRNNGTRAKEVDGDCVYETPDGNHCAVGCFIPDGHRGLRTDASVDRLVEEHADLLKVLPLEKDGLRHLQLVHDGYHLEQGDVRDALCQWIDENVYDDGEAA